MLIAWLAACGGFGWIVHKLLGRDDAWTLVTSLAAGMGLLSLLVLGLGLLGWLNHGSAVALVCVGAAIAVVPVWKFLQKPREDSPGNWAFLILAPLAGMVFFAALIPPGFLWGSDDPSGYDVTEYHLQVPREWFEAGKIVPLHHNVFSFFPFNVEMHYLLAMQLSGGPWARNVSGAIHARRDVRTCGAGGLDDLRQGMARRGGGNSHGGGSVDSAARGGCLQRRRNAPVGNTGDRLGDARGKYPPDGAGGPIRGLRGGGETHGRSGPARGNTDRATYHANVRANHRSMRGVHCLCAGRAFLPGSFAIKFGPAIRSSPKQ